MSDEKLTKLLSLAAMLEQSSLTRVKALIKQERAIGEKISDLTLLPEASASDMDMALLTSRDRWFIWRHYRLEELQKEREAIDEQLAQSRADARRNVGRRQAIEAALHGLRNEKKQLTARREAETSA